MAGVARAASLLRRYGTQSLRSRIPYVTNHTSYSTESIEDNINPVEREIYNRQRQLLPLGLKVPDVAVDAWIAPNATLIGDVLVEDRSIVWYSSVLRGDLNHIKLGAYSNVGAKTIIHAAESSPTGLSAETVIGKRVTIGSNCSLRSCVIEDEVVIGDSSVILEGSLVEKHAILEAGSVVPPGRRIPGGQLWAGNPVRYVRDVTSDEKEQIPKLANNVYEVASTHAEEFLPFPSAYIEAEKLKKDLLSKVSS